MKKIAAFIVLLAFWNLVAGSLGYDSPAESIDGEYTERIQQCEGTTSQATNCITSEHGIRLKQRNSDSYYLYVRTRTGSIYHSCEYVGIAKQKDAQLISGDAGHCEVVVSLNAGVASVTSHGEGCRDFCSAQASILATNLTKKKQRAQHKSITPPSKN